MLFSEKLLIFTQQSVPVHLEESSFGKKEYNGNPAVALEIISLHDTMSGPSWTEKELNCYPKSSLSDFVDWVDDLRQDRFPTDYRGISEHWVSSCPKIMGSLKIMPCSSRQPATGLPKAGQILNSTQQGQHSESHSILRLVSVRDGSFYFPASGQLWIWWEPAAAAHRQIEHCSCYISTRGAFGGIFLSGKTESPAAHAASLGMPDFQLGRKSTTLSIILQKLLICVLICYLSSSFPD